jgi:hypothetical protein
MKYQNAKIFLLLYSTTTQATYLFLTFNLYF